MTRAISIGVLSAVVALAPDAWAAVADPVSTGSGQVAGTNTETPSVRAFKGIPFAAPPVGENRWRAPQPPARWDGVRQANAFGAPCTAGGGGRGRGAPGARGGARGDQGARGGARGDQGARGGRGDGQGGRGAAAAQGRRGAAPAGAPRAPQASEDCLYLNVWTSADRASDRRPVMVWIYGGGFTGGSGSELRYDGERLAAKGPVVVTFNYRLGGLGFFAHPELAKESGRNASGNYGMMDALAALRWVQQNIANFGGDPNNVTIFGESAGAIMIGALVGSPEAKDLFHRAIGQSGGWMGLQMARMADGKQREAANAKTLEAAGITSIAELRAKPLAELPNLGQAGLVIDGYLIPQDLSLTFRAGRQNRVDVLAGSNKDENTFLGGGGRGGRGGAAAAETPGSAVEQYVAQAKKQYGELVATFLKLYPARTDEEVAAARAQFQNDEINWNMRQWAAKQSAVGRKGYAYFFTRVPLQNGQPSPRGATHTAEIQYAFNNPQGVEWNDVDTHLADMMSSYWVNFATTGDPNGPGLPAWPQYSDMSKDRVMVLGDTVQTESQVPAEKLAFFNALYDRLMKGN